MHVQYFIYSQCMHVHDFLGDASSRMDFKMDGSKNYLRILVYA